MTKTRKNELKVGTLIKMHSDESVGVIRGIMSGHGRYAVYSIEWLVNHGDHGNFYQTHVFEVIG
jgi:hypothetical protein